MKPVRLIMQAFGPYAGREVIDFREAVAAGLFGIYGQTGSGKSTIFSAMTFVLFGEATKAEQETQSLRSDHADSGVPTEVEFVFDVGERRYVIRRRPEQMRPKQRGAGEKKDAHEAWLFDATGLSVEEISDTHAGKIIAEKKISSVREAVVELLGYGAEQFRQIVLLPQGKFETFLAAKTDARLEILRELFDVSIYRRLAAKFKEDAVTAERQVRQEREVCAGRLRTEGFESADALVDGIVEAQHSRDEEIRRETEAIQAVRNEKAKLDAARQLDERFQTAEKAKADLDALLVREEEIGELKKRVVNARRAQALVDVEGHFLDAEAELAAAMQKQEKASSISKTATETAKLTAQSLEQEKVRADEIDRLRKNGEALDRHLQTLTDAAVLEKTRREAGILLSKAQNAFDNAVRRYTELFGQKQLGDSNLKVVRENAGERQRLMTEHALVGAAYKAAENYEKAEQYLKEARADVSRLGSRHAASKQLTTHAQARFDSVEASLRTMQALHLATKLVPGDACPVCGSTEHPIPATGRIEHAGLDKVFKDAKATLEEAQATEQENGRHLTSAEAMLGARQERLSELEKPERSAADFRALIASLTHKIEKLGPEINIPSAEAQLAAIGEDINKIEVMRERLRGQLEEARQSEAVTRDRLEQALSTIPDSLRERNALEAAITEIQNALIARQTALAAAEKIANSSRDHALAAVKDAEAATEAQTQALSRRKKAHTTFKTRLAESGITEPQYQSYKPSIATIETDAATVEDFNRKLDLARSQEETTQRAIASLERPELKPIEEILQKAEEAFKETNNRRAQAEARLQHLQNIKGEISNTLLRLEQIEEKSAPLRELAALFNAENAQRLDLETFAIGAMFEQTLLAANQRLGPMTSGRYTLEREVEASGGRARRGLGIRVFDVYTGKPRSPSTLSGGETFIAALALALGLSDVVESMSGKVHLDTIFIDEGFGSLDTENESGTLDQVLQTLTNLVSQRRAVGLISHVPLVQESIPNGFYVRKEVQGSRVEARGAV